MDQWSFCLRIQGISLRLKTNSEGYVKYMKKYFASLELDSSVDADIEVSLDLEETVNEVARFKKWELSDSLKRIGRRVLVGDNEVVCEGCKSTE